MPDTEQVNVTAAKGRPMLTWVGKRPLSHVTAFPAQHVETHDAFGIHGIPTHEPDTGDPQTEFLRALRASWNGNCWEDAPEKPTARPGEGRPAVSWRQQRNRNGPISMRI